MRILLDENLDWRLARDLSEHDVVSVARTSLSGTKNGALLTLAQQEFDVFVSMDSSLPHQQQLQDLDLAVVLLRAPTNRLADTRPLMPHLLQALPNLQKGTETVLSSMDLS